MKKSLLFIFSFLALIPNVFAAWTLIPDDKGNVSNAFKTGNFTPDLVIEFGLYVIQVLIEIAGMVAVILVMIGGYRYVIGSFYEEKDAGKNTIKFALLGFAVCVLSWIIVQIIVSFFISSS